VQTQQTKGTQEPKVRALIHMSLPSSIRGYFSIPLFLSSFPPSGLFSVLYLDISSIFVSILVFWISYLLLLLLLLLLLILLLLLRLLCCSIILVCLHLLLFALPPHFQQGKGAYMSKRSMAAFTFPFVACRACEMTTKHKQN